MKIKSYYARTVEEAVGRASTEMGPDAMLVRSRKAPIEVRHLGPYEVVFAAPGRLAGNASAPGEEAAALRPRTGDAQVSAELTQLRRQMDEIRRTLLARSIVGPATPASDDALERCRQLLAGAGVDDDLAEEIGQIVAAEYLSEVRVDANADADRSAATFREAAFHRIAHAELGRRISADAALPAEGGPAAVAFVGPPGSGKTSLLMKAAVLVNQTAARPVHLVSADAFRIGAAEQLRTCASILGVGMDLCENVNALRQAIDSNRPHVVFIDTPGLSGSDFELLENLAGFLARRGDVEKHLVLPATMRPRDLRRSVEQYECFRPDKLAFTRLDETDTFGALYSAAVWSARPVSFLTAGQQIPEDLELATTDKILQLLLGTNMEAAAEPSDEPIN